MSQSSRFAISAAMRPKTIFRTAWTTRSAPRFPGSLSWRFSPRRRPQGQRRRRRSEERRSAARSCLRFGGSIQRAADIVRIFAELTDGRTGFSRWSASQDYKLTDIFAVESQIAATVAQAMSVQVATIAPAPGGRKRAGVRGNLRGRGSRQPRKDEASDHRR